MPSFIESSETRTISILGCGWLGMALLDELAEQGRYTLKGSSRDPEKVRQIDAISHGFRIDLPYLTMRNASFFDTDVLVITLPPGRRRSNARRLYREEIHAALKAALKLGTRRIIYTSSTGIYGTNIDGIVTENTPPDPQTESTKAVLEAEEVFLNSSIPSTILRLGGLYGPGRSPARWFSGKPLPNSDAPVNMVSQQAAVAALQLVIDKNPPSAVYNICSTNHPTKAQFYTQAADKEGIAAPFPQPGGGNSKKVSPKKAEEELGWKFLIDG